MSAPTVGTVERQLASRALTAELWISLASLLRSHVAMHSVAGVDVQARIISDSDSALELLGPNGKLSIVGPRSSGFGATEFRPEAGEFGDEYATFFFSADGLVHLENSVAPMDFETVVELWLRKVRA